MRFQKKIILLSFSLFTISYSWAQKPIESNPSSLKDSLDINFLSPNQISLTDSIVNYGKLFLNTPYHYGSTGTDTFDCSGFTSYVYRNFGYNLQRNSAEQAQQFDTIDRSQLKTGDLVFFSGRGRSKRVGHVGIVVAAKENGEFDFIHSAVHSGVTISNSTESYYTKRFIKANRVIGFDPMLAVNQPVKNDNTTTPEQPTLIPFSGNVQKSRKIIPAEYHRVKSGETLSSIAQKFGMTIAELKNKNDLKGNKINRNQKLVVREEETVMLVQPAKSIAKTKITDLELANNSASTHIVKKGETLFSISKSLNLSIDDLKSLNNLKSGALSVGQELAINKARNETIKANNAVTETISKINDTHVVQKGENLSSISKKYDISIDDLKKINNLKSGSIKAGQELTLNLPIEPSEVNHTTAQNELKPTSHKVKSGENLSSISKKYNIPIEDLKKINRTDGRAIQIGQEIKLSENNEIASVTNVNTKEKSTNYKVKKGESLYTISKSQNISIDELKSLNDLSSSQIKPGQTLKIIAKNANTISTSKIKTEPKSITHKVSPGESFFSIAKTYSCTIDKIKEWNNKTSNKINIGEKLIIYSDQI